MRNSKWVRDKLQLHKVNEVYLKVSTEASVMQELSDHLTFMVPGAKFSPAFKNKFWDGKIRLLNSLTGLTYAGLVKEISEFALSRNYDIEVDKELQYNGIFDDVNEVIESFKITKQPRDYQIHSFQTAVEMERGIFLSPTASGKSLIIYLLARYYNKLVKQKVLVIVPTVSLVMQMKKDFEDYQGKDLDIHCITAGVDKVSTSPIVISTWQSIYKMPKDWFNQFGCVIGDEVHLFKATSLKSIMEKLINCRYRYGFTGTLDGSLTNRITLEGLFGPVEQVTTTSDLMEQGHVANLKIKALVLKYDKDTRQSTKKLNYQDEMDFLVRHEKRNKFIRNLSLSLEGNSLVLFQYVEKHGKILHDMMMTKVPDRKIFFVHGGVEGDDRERIRGIVETESNAIVVASYGTFSTGINIRNLHNVILASPSKSRIRILQSIGRGLRIGDNKNEMVLYDIADDLRTGSHINFTLQHFTERINIYSGEGFDFKIFNTEI
ncbi:MAG: Prochlorococcus phage [Bacteroidota bacterium]|jgi:superfamily II DNA or RNA helicase